MEIGSRSNTCNICISLFQEDQNNSNLFFLRFLMAVGFYRIAWRREEGKKKKKKGTKTGSGWLINMLLLPVFDNNYTLAAFLAWPCFSPEHNHCVLVEILGREREERNEAREGKKRHKEGREERGGLGNCGQNSFS